ncbi:MAG: TylF/MycF family methyltransferase [Proteobacteria bacterium]|nr:TylF/MycF family methyltransferase [Pseudomonadota bacterium]
MTEAHIQEIVNRVALAKIKRKRVSFWGWNETVAIALYRKNLLNGLDFLFVSDQEEHQNKRVLATKIEPPRAIYDFQPDELVILYFTPEEAIPIYERLVIDYKQDPLYVFMVADIWNTQLYVADTGYQDCLRRMPAHIRGGVADHVTKFLYEGVKHIITHNIPGNIVNFGVFQGWSMYFISTVLQHFGQTDRFVIGFDTFTGFTEAQSIYDVFSKLTTDGVYEATRLSNTSLELTQRNLDSFSHVRLIQGDVVETIHLLDDQPIALAFYDMDDYTPTKHTLGPVFERLSMNGVFIMDHFEYYTIYGGHTMGQRIALLEFLEENPMYHSMGTNMFLKMKN